MKFLWFDTETTGTDPKVHDVIQLAGQVVIGGRVMEEFNLTCQPFDWDSITDKALEVNGKTREELRDCEPPQEMYKKIVKIFDRYVNKFDKEDKFYAAGHNINFDINFMNQFFKKNGNEYFFSYIHGAHLCTLTLAVITETIIKKRIFKPNYKLSSVCECLNIELINSHDALADITSTRQAANVMLQMVRRNENE